MSLLGRINLDNVTPALLWRALAADDRRAALASIYREMDDRSYRKEVNRALAAQLRFRESAVAKLPLDKKFEYLEKAMRPDDDLASTLILGLHLGARRTMLGEFLDALEIPHDGGMIDGAYDFPELEPARLAAAAERLYAAYPEERVDVYLAALLAMDDESWSPLRELLAARAPAS